MTIRRRDFEFCVYYIQTRVTLLKGKFPTLKNFKNRYAMRCQLTCDEVEKRIIAVKNGEINL